LSNGCEAVPAPITKFVLHFFKNTFALRDQKTFDNRGNLMDQKEAQKNGSFQPIVWPWSAVREAMTDSEMDFLEKIVNLRRPGVIWGSGIERVRPSKMK